MNRVAWGLGNNIVTHKLGIFASEGPQDAERTQNIIDVLFRNHPVRKTENGVKEAAEILIFSEEDLRKAVGSLQTKRHQGRTPYHTVPLIRLLQLA